MKPILKLFLGLAIYNSLNFSKAQVNLIYNGDFELYDTCPSYTSDPLIEMEIEHCLGWRAPTWGSSDYFNTCNNSINGFVGVPYNVLGYQMPKSGNAYCGFLAYSQSNGGCYAGLYWWEYIQGQFNQPLIKDHIYYFSYYFNLSNWAAVATDEIGFYISTDAISSCSPAPLNYVPQIKSLDGYFINDTLNWVEISGFYWATGGEKYITIGNFNDSTYTDTVTFQILSGLDSYAYYYIDAGVTEDYTALFQLPNIFTPNGDGVNDEWIVAIDNPDFNVTIFNRWGNEILNRTLVDFSWNGADSNGKMCSDGVYYYLIQSKNNTDNKKKIKGFIQLVK